MGLDPGETVAAAAAEGDLVHVPRSEAVSLAVGHSWDSSSSARGVMLESGAVVGLEVSPHQRQSRSAAERSPTRGGKVEVGSFSRVVAWKGGCVRRALYSTKKVRRKTPLKGRAPSAVPEMSDARRCDAESSAAGRLKRCPLRLHGVETSCRLKCPSTGRSRQRLGRRCCGVLHRASPQGRLSGPELWRRIVPRAGASGFSVG